MAGKGMVINAKYVKEKLKDFVEDEDLSRYIL
jgi:ATP-dependent protease HslVU (ClpYQ) ATPase subunit